MTNWLPLQTHVTWPHLTFLSSEPINVVNANAIQLFSSSDITYIVGPNGLIEASSGGDRATKKNLLHVIEMTSKVSECATGWKDVAE